MQSTLHVFKKNPYNEPIICQYKRQSAPMHACMTRCRKSGRWFQGHLGADEDLVLMGGGGEEGGGWLGPRAMTSLCAHVILLRWSPISRDSQLSRMGREGRSNPGDSGSHSPKERERRARRGGHASRAGLCLKWVRLKRHEPKGTDWLLVEGDISEDEETLSPHQTREKSTSRLQQL